jgi:hypothetical protein
MEPHSRRRAGIPYVATPVFAAVLVLTACGGSHLASRWTQRSITVDGSASDWEGAMQQVGDGPIQVGVENDGESLYLCLEAAADQEDARRLARGFTLWLDPSGKKEHVLGVRFPPAFAGRWHERGEAEGTLPDSAAWDPERLNAEIQVLRPGEEPSRLGDLVGTMGVEAKMGGPAAERVYEVRIPLHAEGGLNVAPGTQIGLGVESNEHRSHGPGGPRPEGDMGGFGGGYGGGNGGEFGGGGEHHGGYGGQWAGMGHHYGGQGRGEPFHVWTKLALAKETRKAGSQG